MDLILYDGVCGLCDRFVQFVLPRDRHDRFRFAPLQSDLAKTQLQAMGFSDTNMSTVCVISDFGTDRARLFVRSDAALFVLSHLGGLWRVMGWFTWVPRFVRDGVYDAIAKRRYRWFGRFEVCQVPQASQKHKFLG